MLDDLRSRIKEIERTRGVPPVTLIVTREEFDELLQSVTITNPSECPGTIDSLLIYGVDVVPADKLIKIYN